ncbi:MAG TPA: hypothetical protein VI457_08955 [Methylococcaceae bacterium]|nr:hypothetical protein [Methylococcaceae bacterium]
MKRPSFLEGVAVALLAALLGGGLHTLLGLMFSPGSAARLLIAALGLGYLLYLLTRSGGRVGRITALASWGLMAFAAWWLAPSLPVYALLHLAAIWLIRALYFQGGILAALLDGGLCGLGLGAALAALIQTHSIALAIWCFFLTQALFTAIPNRWPGKNPIQPVSDDRFEQAHRSAEAALRRLLSI